MDDQHEMARLHSAGAIVRHPSPFDNLPSHKNSNELTADFIRKWAVPYYLKIRSDTNLEWIELINGIKAGITKDVSLSLLGDFNWRTRLVGSYFAAVKGYTDLIDIIGTHLLKSELCCVGHIYALTLAFFNKEQSLYYLNAYLDYYLTKPDLYFDQKSVLEALLYLDKINNTDHAGRHMNNWKTLLEERMKVEQDSAIQIAKMLSDSGEISKAQVLLESLEKNKSKNLEEITIRHFDEQVEILKELSEK